MEDGSKTIEWLFRMLTGMHHNYLRNEFEKRGLREASHPHILFTLRYKTKDKMASQKELSDALRISPATVAVSIKRMEKSGLVRKVSDRNDLRRNLITLTEKGEKLVDESAAVFGEFEKRMYEGFTENEKTQLKHFYLRIIQNLENTGIQPPAHIKRTN